MDSSYKILLKSHSQFINVVCWSRTVFAKRLQIIVWSKAPFINYPSNSREQISYPQLMTRDPGSTGFTGPSVSHPVWRVSLLNFPSSPHTTIRLLMKNKRDPPFELMILNWLKTFWHFDCVLSPRRSKVLIYWSLAIKAWTNILFTSASTVVNLNFRV